MSSDLSPLLVVGIGASAGGIEALKRFFTTVPEDSPLAFIVVLHLDPEHKSKLAEIMGRETRFSFSEAKQHQVIEAGKACVIPPNAYIEIKDRVINLIKPLHKRSSRFAIDHFFKSMSSEYESKSVGLLFSGSGNDGTAGLRALKASGGLSMAQTPATAEYPSMPQSAVDAGVVDQVLEVENIYERLLEYAKHLYQNLPKVQGYVDDSKCHNTISALPKAEKNAEINQYEPTKCPSKLNDSPLDMAKSSLLAALNPSLLLDENNRILYLHGDVDRFLRLPVGQTELNFFTMLEPELRSRVRSGIYECRSKGHQTVVNPPAHYQPSDTSKKRFKAIISPVLNSEQAVSSIVVSFDEASTQVLTDVDPSPFSEIQKQDAIIDALEKELLETKQELQNTVEELQTNTEELKAAHEEALSINEELRSSNEELEASTDELRPLNEALREVNAELKDKIEELSSTHNDIKNLLASTKLATVFLSNELKVKRFTPAAERLLSIGKQDIGRRLDKVSGKFADEVTLSEAKQVLESLESLEKEIEVDGKWFLQKILPYQTEDRRIDGLVLTYSDITRLRYAVNNLKASGKKHAVIAALGIKALSTDNMNEFMEQLVREVAHTLKVDFSQVLQYQPEYKQLLLKAGVGWQQGLVGEMTFNADASTLAGSTLGSSNPIIVDDVATEQRFSGLSLLTEHKIVSGVGCVIKNGNNRYGTLSVYTVNYRKFTQDDSNFLVSAANILSVSLQRSVMEAKLKDSEKRLRIAKNSNQMGSFEYVFDSGEVSWDPLLIDIWGLDDNSNHIDHFFKGLHPEDKAHVEKAIAQAMQPSGDGHYSATYRVSNKRSKEIIWVEATGQVLFVDGVAEKMIGMAINITDKMALESSLKDAVEQLSEANEKKNQFLAILGHEIRNPLAAIASGVQIIERDKSQLDRAVAMIANNVRIVSSLLDDLLDLTRITRGQINLKKQLINFNELLSSLFQSFSQRCENKQQKVTLKLSEVDVVSYVDSTRVQQVISNVTGNAHKFTQEGGRIDIELRARELEFDIIVSDTGVGFDMAYKDKVFEPFQQLKQSDSVVNSGLGIGLALVKQLVSLHDGSVSIVSAGEGKGTTFIITMPIVNEKSLCEAVPDDQADVGTAINNLNQLKVLIVDDNEDASYGLSLILRMKGCVVHACSDGRSALSEFADFAPSVLILDIGLPDMMGYDLLKQITRKSSGKMLKIALTGFSHKEAQDRSKQAGFDYHMTKPVNIDYLLRVLSHQVNLQSTASEQ